MDGIEDYDDQIKSLIDKIERSLKKSKSAVPKSIFKLPYRMKLTRWESYDL